MLLCNLHGAQYTVNCTVCTVQFALYSVHSTLCTVQCALCTVIVSWLQNCHHLTHQLRYCWHSTRCYSCLGPVDRAKLKTICTVLHSSLYSVQCAQYTAHWTVFTAGCTLYTVYTPQYVLHSMYCTVHCALCNDDLHHIRTCGQQNWPDVSRVANSPWPAGWR